MWVKSWSSKWDISSQKNNYYYNISGGICIVNLRQPVKLFQNWESAKVFDYVLPHDSSYY